MFNAKDKKEIQEFNNANNSIGKGTVIEGNIETFGNIRVDGKIIGNLKSKSKVVLGETAYIEGNILAQNAEIAGQVNGVAEVSESLVLKPTSVINGDIITNRLEVEAGANFNGTSKMGAKIKEIKLGEESKEFQQQQGKREQTA